MTTLEDEDVEMRRLHDCFLKKNIPLERNFQFHETFVWDQFLFTVFFSYSSAMSSITLTFLIVCIIQSCQPFQIKRFEVPSEVPEGGLIELRCDYELIPYKQLYTLRWLKNNVEFYRFDPALKPEHNFYRMHGLHVNVSII